MLSIAKLRVGQEAYQLSGVAQSLDAYYTGAGEATGRWLGGGTARLGLDGEVAPDDLRAVLAGLAPGSGGLTPNGTQLRPHPRRVPGFDLTFKAPKSASVLYAVSDDPRVQAAVIEAGETAMRAALDWLEREAIRVRRGSHNQAWLAAHRDEPGVGPRELSTSGVVAASFRHRTSRSGDPLLHWHVLVANMAEGRDGRWSALYGAEVYRHARAAGEVFQAVLRDELTASLGVEWRPGRHVPEIAGIPQSVLDLFSKRSTEVEAWLAATGTPDTAEGRQAAVLATRRSKPEVEHARFDEAWKAEAEAAGWGPDAAERLVGWSLSRTATDGEGSWRLDAVGFDEHGCPERYERVVDPEEWIAHLLRTRLTIDQSTFTEPDVARAVAASQGEGATIETIERITDRVLASHQVIAVAAPEGVPPRWTSRELLAVEARFLAALSITGTAEPLTESAADRAVARQGTLGSDQLAAIDTITAATSPVAVLVGPAGTGKTFTMDAIRTTFEHAGYRVSGAAPSARAALELSAGACIGARTMHSLVDAWRTGHDTPTPRSLLIVDEAGMADIRTLEAVVTGQVAAGGRVLLVGDHHQLPEVGPGGGFGHAARHGPCVAQLTVNRRQRQSWEREALRELREGSVARAVEAYVDHDRVVVTDSPPAMIDAAVDKWFEARAARLDPVLLAGTNQLVEALNQAVIARLIATGDLSGDSVTFGTGSFRVGERAVIRRNSTEHTADGEPVMVANGHTGVVTGATADAVTIRLDRGGDAIVIGHDYLDAGGEITHAYALTGHRSQGGNWDLGIAVGTDGLYREGAYLELSRGGYENWIVLTAPEAAELHRQAVAELERHDTGLVPPAEQSGNVGDELIDRMRRSRAKALAHSLDPDLESVDRLARTVRFADLEVRHAGALTAERIAADRLGYHGGDLADEFASIDYVARHIAIGHAVSPSDRHNVGMVIALDDTAGAATVHFVSLRGHEATKTFAWQELRLVSPSTPEPRILDANGADRLDSIHNDFEARIDAWATTLRSLGVQPGDTDRYWWAIQRRLDLDTRTLTSGQPAWLTELIGPRPADIAGARTWNDAVRDIARWCARRDTSSNAHGLGTRPEGPAGADWDRLNLRLCHTRTWLSTTDRLPSPTTILPSHRELVERRHELNQILAAAPPDWRDTITQLQRGQLSLDNTAELLQAALDGQDTRRAWIIGHWPHVVEYQEINRTLTTGNCGPDLTDLLDDLATRSSGHLATAIGGNEPWLRVAISHLVDDHTAPASDEAVQYLHSVADYRQRWQISGPEPLGQAPADPNQADERAALELGVTASGLDIDVGV